MCRSSRDGSGPFLIPQHRQVPHACAVASDVIDALKVVIRLDWGSCGLQDILPGLSGVLPLRAHSILILLRTVAISLNGKGHGLKYPGHGGVYGEKEK
jgi:hypothetical protein